MKGKIKFWLVAIMALALLVNTATTVLARVEGEPDLKATVIGSNEFRVGQGGALQIMVENKGTFSGEMEDPDDKVMAVGYLTPMGVTLVPPCTTAVGTTATLESGSSSIEVLGETAAVGTLPSGRSTMQPIAFHLRVDKDAKPGTYKLTLKLEYQYLKDVDWLNPPEEGEESSPYYEPQFEFDWGSEVQREDISVKVIGTYFSARVTQTEGIRVGATGIIAVSIENSGFGEAHDVTAEIAPGGNFVPVDRGSFLGDISGGNSATAEFRVSVSEEAIVKTSPLDILIKYKDENDIPRQSLITVGVAVEKELEFEVGQVDLENELTPGVEGVVSVPIKNTSNSEVRDVLARVNVIDPFTSTDETSYVGALQAGETGTAKFRISVDNDAVPKTYALDVVVKYWDSEGNSYMSKPMKVKLEVKPASGLSEQTVALIIGMIVAIAGVSSYLIVKKRRKRLISAKG